MLCLASQMEGRHVRARDGEVGRVEDLFFDDARWGVRYLVVSTGGWLGGRRVLLSPASVARHADASGPVAVALTREQIERSPDVDAEKPVSRRHEIAHALHYGYPFYWSGPFIWGAGIFPGVVPMPTTALADDADAAEIERAARHEEAEADRSHLRSARAVRGYDVQASDGSAGSLEDLVVDLASWGIVRLVVDARPWWPGGQVLVPPDAVVGVDWATRSIGLRCTRAEVSDGPAP